MMLYAFCTGGGAEGEGEEVEGGRSTGREEEGQADAEGVRRQVERQEA